MTRLAQMTRAKKAMQPLSMRGRVFSSGNAIPPTSRRNQVQGGSQCSVERFGVMLSRGARWNQLWGDLGRFIAVQALPSPVFRKPVHLARACCPAERDCLTACPAAISGVWGSEIGGMWGRLHKGDKPGADRRHGKSKVPSIRLLPSLPRNETHKSNSDG